MEVFKVFATLSLGDMISGPLGKIKGAMKAVDEATAGLGNRMGKLAVAMAPVAIASGVILGGLLSTTAAAMDFEDAMADVAKVIDFDTDAEFRAMNQSVKELAGRLPMAADGIAAIVAAAGQSGVAKNDLVEFAEQATKMGIAFDLSGDQAGKTMADWRAGMNLSLPRVYALADAVNHLSNSMNATAPALAEVVQRVGPLAMSAGLAETQVAALGAAFLSAGASPEVAATALRKFTSTLVLGSAMADRQAEAFKRLGFNSVQMAKDMQTDAQGTIMKVMKALAGQKKELQVAMLTEMFGEQGLGAIAPLLANMENLDKAFGLVADSAAYAGSMQAEFDQRSKTTSNALQLLRNKLTNLAISVGTIFLPVISWAAQAFGVFVDAIRAIVDSPFGQWLLKITAAISGIIIGITAFSGAMWAVSKIGPIIAKALLPLKTAILGLGWPILAVIAAVGLLYLAWKNNFGGIQETVGRWWKNITTVFKGVTGIFKALTGTTFELRGELAKDIKAAGLENLVVSIAKIIHRIKAFFKGIWDGLDFSRPLKILEPIGAKIAAVLDRIGRIFARLTGTEVTSATDSFTKFGQVVGGVLTWGLEALAAVINAVVNGFLMTIDTIDWLISLLSGDFAGAAAAGERVWNSFCDTLMGFLDLFRIGDWCREAWADAQNFLGSIDLFESGAAILETLKNGIASKFTEVKDSVVGFFSGIREYLPFSDAKKGPFSDLTLSGSRFMTTIAEGMEVGAKGLDGTVSGIFDTVAGQLGSWWDGLFSDSPKAPHIDPVQVDGNPARAAQQQRAEEKLREAKQGLTIHINKIELPNVQDGPDFVKSLRNVVTEYGG